MIMVLSLDNGLILGCVLFYGLYVSFILDKRSLFYILCYKLYRAWCQKQGRNCLPGFWINKKSTGTDIDT